MRAMRAARVNRCGPRVKGVSETVFMFLSVGDETKMVDCSWCLKGDELLPVSSQTESSLKTRKPSYKGEENRVTKYEVSLGMRKAVNEGVNDELVEEEGGETKWH